MGPNIQNVEEYRFGKRAPKWTIFERFAAVVANLTCGECTYI
jgi:hypothetical protein